jgi:hypothetical protein
MFGLQDTPNDPTLARFAWLLAFAPKLSPTIVKISKSGTISVLEIRRDQFQRLVAFLFVQLDQIGEHHIIRRLSKADGFAKNDCLFGGC